LSSQHDAQRSLHLGYILSCLGGEQRNGVSFLINTQCTAEGRSPGSLAWAGLANTYFWLDTTRKIGGVILMQLLPFFDKTALDLFATFERGVYDSLYTTKAAA
jgi:CubicO group peptidase (beta-lactamase class C family)